MRKHIIDKNEEQKSKRSSWKMHFKIGNFLNMRKAIKAFKKKYLQYLSDNFQEADSDIFIETIFKSIHNNYNDLDKGMEGGRKQVYQVLELSCKKVKEFNIY